MYHPINNFIPNTVLLNKIYIPEFDIPKLTELSGKDIILESDINGNPTIINLSNPDKKWLPFIDISKYDNKRRQWVFEDDDGLIFTIIDNLDLEFSMKAYDYSSSEKLLSCLSLNYNLGYNLTDLTISIDNLTKKEKYVISGYELLRYEPIIVLVDGVKLKDVTHYFSNVSDTLNDILTTQNKEFYFNDKNNRLYTNQNLTGVRKEDIKIYIYTLTDYIKLKCRMASNIKTHAYVTPIIDYYIVKLNGQSFRE